MILDVTRELHEGHPVWPGDTPFETVATARIADGDSVNVMRLSATMHLGTHLDAPWHYDDGGARLEAWPLERLIGEARVLHAEGSGPVGPELLNGVGPLPERVLIRTGVPARWEAFPEFRPLTPELIRALRDRGCRLVGTDAPSVDAVDSKELPTHAACRDAAMAIVEGLELSSVDVDAGRYRLICLPLRIPHADASPVRALLEPLPSPAGTDAGTR